MKTIKAYFVIAILLRFCYATSGPSTPEVASFTPVDQNDMVNLVTGDFSYNLPIIHIPGPAGGYKMSLFYHAGISTDQEASWVGLGWNLQPGAITRTVIGFPDDYKDKRIDHKTNDIGANIGLSFGFNLGLLWILENQTSISANYSFKESRVNSVTGYLFNRPVSRERFGRLVNNTVSVNTMDLTTKEDIEWDRRWNAVGNFLNSSSFGMRINGLWSYSMLGDFIGTVTAPFTDSIYPVFTTNGTGSIDGSFSMRFGSLSVDAFGSRYSSDTTSNNNPRASSDIILETDQKTARARYKGGKTPRPFEGMVHLASDIYNINAQGINGSMRLVPAEDINLKTRRGIETSVGLNLFNNDTENESEEGFKGKIIDIANSMGDTDISFSLYSKTSTNSNGNQPSFQMLNQKNNGGYKIHTNYFLSGNAVYNHLIDDIMITNPSGVTYHFSEEVFNYTQKSWNSSLAPGETKKVLTSFPDLVFGGYIASYGLHENDNPYPYSWLLKKIESPLGNTIDFHYMDIPDSITWRSPVKGTGYVSAKTANNRSQVSYGKKQVKYIGTIETETHVGLFLTSTRDDIHDIVDFVNGGINGNTYLKKLDDVVIFAKGNGWIDSWIEDIATLAQIPVAAKNYIIKRINFDYTYDLCANTPTAQEDTGKLTLAAIKIYGKGGAGYSIDYSFSYKNNPDYHRAHFDRWGYYSSLGAPRWEIKSNYQINGRHSSDAAAWSLTDIKLPTGADIQIDYENDHYHWAGNNDDLPSSGVAGGGLRVKSLAFVDSSLSGNIVLNKTNYEYGRGATSTEPLAYTNLHTNEMRYEQFLDDGYGSITVSQAQNGNFFKLGPGVHYKQVTEHNLDSTAGKIVNTFITPDTSYFRLEEMGRGSLYGSSIPQILKIFRHIGIFPSGKALCAKVRFFGEICLLPRVLGYKWFLPGFRIPITFGNTRKEARAIFGPFGHSKTKEAISVGWDISKGQYNYRFKDYSAMVGKQIKRLVYNQNNELQQKVEYAYYSPNRKGNYPGHPIISTGAQLTLTTEKSSEPSISYSIRDQMKTNLLGVSFGTSGIHIEFKVDKEIKHKTNYEYYPYLTKSIHTHFYDDGNSRESWQEFAGFDAKTQTPMLTYTNHPEDHSKVLYHLVIPAYQTYPWLAQQYNIYDGFAQKTAGVVIGNSRPKPLSSTIQLWSEISNPDTIPAVTQKYIWKGGVAETILNLEDNAWLKTEELIEITDLGLPQWERDGLGTDIAFLYDLDRIILVSANASPNEIKYINFHSEPNVGAKAGAYKVLSSTDSYTLNINAQGKNYLDFICRSQGAESEIEVKLVNTSGATVANIAVIVSPRWQYIKIPFEAADIGSILMESDSDIDIDEIRVYPRGALVKNFIYDPDSFALIAIEDENGQIRNYRYNHFNQLSLIRNSRDELLRRIYYDKKMMVHN